MVDWLDSHSIPTHCWISDIPSLLSLLMLKIRHFVVKLFKNHHVQHAIHSV